MPPPSNTEKTETQRPSARRSTRLAIAIPITLSGKDERGNSFKENTRTLVVNKHGAKIATTNPLALGAEVEVENRALGLTTRASVVWRSEKRTDQNLFEMGIQLFQADNIWGIEFPPQDWQEGPPIGAGGQKLEKGASLPVTSPPPVAAPPAAAPKAHPAPAPTATKPPASPTPKAPDSAKAATPPAGAPLSPAQITVEFNRMLQHFTRQVEEIAAQKTKSYQDNLEALSRQIGIQAQVNLQESAAPALRVEIQKWVGQELETARETLVAHAREQMQDDSAAAAEGAHRDTGERLQKLTEEYLAQSQPELVARFAEQSEQAKAHFAQAIQSAMAGELGGLKAQSESLVSDFEDRLHRSGDKEVLEASEHLHKAADDSKGSIAKEFHEQSLEASKALKDELKASWKGLAEDVRKQLLNLTTHTAESMNTEACAGLEKFRHQLQQTVKDLQEKSAEELEDHLQNLGKRKREELIHELQNDAEEAGRSSAEVFSTQLEGLAGSGLDKIGQELVSLLDRHRKELEEVTKLHQNKAMEEVQSKLQYVTERLAEDSAAQLTTQMKETVEMAVFKLQESRDNIVNEAEEAFRARLAEVIAPALKPIERRSKPRESSEPAKDKG
jgi:hypothetical protein